MTCAETEILLHALLDGELDAGHARDVEAHLEGCPRCAAQFRAHREMQQAMSAAQLRYTAPMSLRHRIESALPSAPKRVSNLRSVLKGFVMGMALSTALAASLVIAVIRTDQDQRVLGDVMSAHVRSLQGDLHRRADERPAYGETMVQRQGRYRTAGRGPDGAGLHAARREARLH
jgi:anti-sigma factor RsiW